MKKFYCVLLICSLPLLYAQESLTVNIKNIELGPNVSERKALNLGNDDFEFKLVTGQLKTLLDAFDYVSRDQKVISFIVAPNQTSKRITRELDLNIEVPIDWFSIAGSLFLFEDEWINNSFVGMNWIYDISNLPDINRDLKLCKFVLLENMKKKCEFRIVNKYLGGLHKPRHKEEIVLNVEVFLNE